MADFESQNGTTSRAVDLSSSTTNNTAAKVVNENVAEISFGKEFEGVEIVSNARVSVFLQHTAAEAARNDEELNEVYRKSLKYVDRFNSMKDPENNETELVHELENLQE